jgi:hypothetical protein
MTAPREWEQWESQWRTERTSPDELAAMLERTTRARRGIVVVRSLSILLAVAALAVVIAALRHAANAFEAALGLVVGVGIAAVWLMDAANQRDARAGAEAPTNEYRSTRRALCIRQDRFARLGWIVVTLDLIFLIPWWIGGIAVHGGGFHLAQVLTVWGPLVLMAGFVAWTISLRRRARAELARLSATEAGDVR